MDARVLFLVRVAEGRQRDVLRLALMLEAVQHGATSGTRELLLLGWAKDAGLVGRAARHLADLEGVESVTCTGTAPLSA